MDRRIKKEDIKYDFHQKLNMYIDENIKKGFLITDSLDDDLKTLRVLIEVRDLIMLNNKQRGVRPHSEDSIYFFCVFDITDEKYTDKKDLYIETINKWYEKNRSK